MAVAKVAVTFPDQTGPLFGDYLPRQHKYCKFNMRYTWITVLCLMLSQSELARLPESPTLNSLS